MKMSGGTHGQKCSLASAGDWIQGVPGHLCTGIILSNSPALRSLLRRVEDGRLAALVSVLQDTG